MGSVEINPNAPPKEPELHLLVAQEMFEEPLWKSLSRQLDEFFFPKKLPPLKLESKPEPVKDIWGFYNYKKDGMLGSTGVHVLIAAIIVGGALWAHRVVTAAPAPKLPLPVARPRSCIVAVAAARSRQPQVQTDRGAPGYRAPRGGVNIQ